MVAPHVEPVLGWFTLKDGTRLRIAHWRASSRWIRGTVLLMTGRAEFLEKYDETVGTLLARGFQVIGFDWRNQGLSDRPLSNPQIQHLMNFDTLTDDLDQVLAGVVEPLASGPLIMLAHSMGGMPATLHLINHADRYAAAIFSAPMYDFFTGPIPRRLAVVLAEHFCTTGRAEEYAFWQGDYKSHHGLFTPFNFFTSDRRRFAVFHDAFRARPELRVGGVTFGWVRAALRASDYIQHEAPLERVTTPVLILSAPGDLIVRSAAHRVVAARLGNATVNSYSDAKHELLMECDAIRDRIWADIDAFLAGIPA